jgi:hypothetical protein
MVGLCFQLGDYRRSTLKLGGRCPDRLGSRCDCTLRLRSASSFYRAISRRTGCETVHCPCLTASPGAKVSPLVVRIFSFSGSLLPRVRISLRRNSPDDSSSHRIIHDNVVSGSIRTDVVNHGVIRMRFGHLTISVVPIQSRGDVEQFDVDHIVNDDYGIRV